MLMNNRFSKANLLRKKIKLTLSIIVGWCKRNPSWMKQFCPESCRFCEKKPGNKLSGQKSHINLCLVNIMKGFQVFLKNN